MSQSLSRIQLARKVVTLLAIPNSSLLGDLDKLGILPFRDTQENAARWTII
jgi:hypothetical protein